MTNQHITLPEPHWYEVISEDGLKVEMHKTDEAAVDAALDMGGVVEINHLITTDQAEAYADARVQEALAAQKPYGYHIVSEENGNGIAFCPYDHAEQITEFLKLNPGTTIRAVAIIPPTNKG